MNCFALTILLLIYFNIRRRDSQYLLEQKLFFALILSDAFILILDAAMWFLDGRPGILSGAVYSIVTALYYVGCPTICLIWYFYVDYHIFRSKTRLEKIRIVMAIPALLIFVLSIVSMFKAGLFYIDEKNIYHRGSLFLLMAGVSFFYIVYTLGVIVKHRKTIMKDFMPLFTFIVPPVVGAVIQSIFYGVSLIWVCVTLSILIIFINIQNNQLYTDYLTGLYNRRQLDNYLMVKIQSAENRAIAGIMIDLDCFKKINDMYGHNSGDQALKYTAEILRKTFRKNDFMARYGGDEFFIVVDVQDKPVLSEIVERLNENVVNFNVKKIAPYEISLSVGYDFYPYKSGITVIEFLEHIDNLMYSNKHENARIRNNPLPEQQQVI